jgi:hypothetical protein
MFNIAQGWLPPLNGELLAEYQEMNGTAAGQLDEAETRDEEGEV